jgi:hypothetical protein
MNTFSFSRNIVAALVLSTLAAAMHGALQPFIGSAEALRVALLVTAFGYLAFLLQQLRPPFGMVLILAGTLLLSFALLAFNPPLLVWLGVMLALLWLVRCVLRYQHLTHCMLDALINGLAVCVGLSVVLHTHSLWLGAWSYFLALAFCALLPSRQQASSASSSYFSSFQQARSSAESALRRLQKNSVHPS